jgi:hypothetical protein
MKDFISDAGVSSSSGNLQGKVVKTRRTFSTVTTLNPANTGPGFCLVVKTQWKSQKLTWFVFYKFPIHVLK